ncbi:hypothetical protein APHAL10511_004061 [Amanita phalloides]|nr:hypothetical protein APHAL10511_004061 [Amanita phalloides]
MPGPGNKGKNRGKAKQSNKQNSSQGPPGATESEAAKCLTMEEDEITRCGQPAVEGYPTPSRCKVHHGQYLIMYIKYKDASKEVDEIKHGQELPTNEQISRYTDWHLPLDKARWVRRYLESIRVEKAGRELHSKRFFLKGKSVHANPVPLDDGHKMRLKLLHKEMVKAVETLDKLQGRAYELYTLNNPAAREMLLKSGGIRSTPHKPRPAETLIQVTQSTELLKNLSKTEGRKLIGPPPAPAIGGEDLIDIELRERKNALLAAFELFLDPECRALKENLSLPDSEGTKDILNKIYLVYQQYARRIIFYEPTLFMKSLDKVSLKDLIISDDFTVEDAVKFIELFSDMLAIGLKWCKDAVIDALAISRHGTAANVGSVQDRFQILGGWIFDRPHTKTIPNEAWWYLLKVISPPADVENRLVRLCNNFDDILGFLAFGALGLYPAPSFCNNNPSSFMNAGLSRGHLSLCGVIVADMVSTHASPMPNPIPTTRKAKRRGCVVWADLESRAYLFGAIKNEDDDFTRAFIRELRARPNLFQVITRSETDPGQVVETFGAGPGEVLLPSMRARNFEAPAAPLSNPPPGYGEWIIARSAHDILYGLGGKGLGGAVPEIPGYLTSLSRNLKGWFFSFKTFPVKYFVILDTVPNRNHTHLARNVTWAALCAKGYGEGDYTLRKYARASDQLFQACAEERLGWMPKNAWSATKMEDQLA